MFDFFKQPKLVIPDGMSKEAYQAEQNSFMTKVYAWMCSGLLVTALVSYVLYLQDSYIDFLADNGWFIWVNMGISLALVFAISWATRSRRVNSAVAAGLFFLYASVVGSFFATIFVVYAATSIASVFIGTAGSFAALSLYGYTTKRDLSIFGTIAYMALVGLIIAMFLNIFIFDSNSMSYITAIIGVPIFAVLTAYDTQRIKASNIIGNAGTDEDRKEAISGALNLYLDFINLFIDLLRIFGDTK